MQSIRVLIVLNIILKVNGVKILAVFPTPSISHQVAFRPLIHELAKRGHDVTVITTDPAFPKGKSPSNLKEIDVHDVSYNTFRGAMEKHQGNKDGLFRQVKQVFSLLALVFEKEMQVEESRKLFNEKFDLIIVEAYIRPTLGLAHVFKAPVIQISSLGTGGIIYDKFGAPSHPLLYAAPMSQRVYNLTFFEKIDEFCKNYLLEYALTRMEEYEHEVMKRIFGNDVPGYEELEKQVQMLFLNEHPIWSGNHPVPPNIVYIGGIHQTPERELAQEFKTILDKSKNGVIYISFGTNVNPLLLPSEKIADMTKVLSQLPYDVLWKWNEDDLPGKSNNIRTFKWFPQSDLLRHPKVKLFITQGGIQSADEAITAAVPLVGIPMISDQWYNVEKFVHHGVGLKVELNELTEETFGKAVRSVLEDKSFKNNMLKLRAQMREYPIAPLDLAVWWVEHIIRNGGEHLRSPAFGMSWFEYYEVRVVLTVVAICLTFIVALIVSLLFIVSFFKKFLFCKNVTEHKKED